MELVLLGGLGDIADIRTENEWRSADCPAITRHFVNKQREFAKFVMEAGSHEEAVGSLMTLQWAWDRRKTKQDTDESSLQEAGQRVFNTTQNALSDRMDDRGWTNTAKEFSESVKILCDMLDALDCEVNVENYPRVMYEAGRQKVGAAEQQEDEVEHTATGQQQEGTGEGTSGRRGRHDRRGQEERQSQQAAENRVQEDDEGGDDMRYPVSPRPRRTNPDTRESGGWDAIDNMTMDQCASMPIGMHTVEFIPNSL